jgi:hypothetical protein
LASLDIFEAASRGDVARATELAKWNPAVARLRSPDGRTPLHFAAAGGQSAMITWLSVQGADLSAGPESPLLTTVDFPDRKVAFAMSQALLINASDANAKRRDGRSALDLALARGYTEIAELLVHRGAVGPGADSIAVPRVYFGKRYSYTVSGTPYQRDDLDGLPQDFINDFARLAHFDAARVKHLYKMAPGLIHGRATWDEMAVEAAAHMGLTDLARFLADEGAPVSTCTATLIGLGDRVKAMVTDDGACVRERGAHDLPILAYTVYGEARPEIAEILLRGGADVRANAFGLTALHLAAGKGYVALAEVLLAGGADVNAAGTFQGREITPLARAAAAGQNQMADFLKARGGRS